jgi:hypothetical protein
LILFWRRHTKSHTILRIEVNMALSQILAIVAFYAVLSLSLMAAAQILLPRRLAPVRIDERARRFTHEQ